MLGVSTSGYYAWRRRPPSRRALSREIAQIHEQSRGTYGARRVQAQLRVDGSGVSRRRVARLMRAGGLQGQSGGGWDGVPGSVDELMAFADTTVA